MVVVKSLADNNYDDIVTGISNETDDKRVGELERMLCTSFSLPEDYIGYLDYVKIRSTYGADAIKRFYRGVTETVTDTVHDDGATNKNLHNKRDKLIKALVFPATAAARMYDFIFDRVKSRIVASGLFASVLGFAFINGVTTALGGPSGLYALYTNASQLLYTQGFIFGAGMISLLSITYGEGYKFSGKNVDTKTIRSDIKKFTAEFNTVWRKYEERFVKKPRLEISLADLNGLYMLVTTDLSKSAAGNRHLLNEHDKNLLPAIEDAVKKKVSLKSIIHHSPSNVGGITLIFSAAFGKLTRKHAYGPIFVNTDRISANPSYDFAVAHEFAHASGKISEPAANFYALRAFERLAERFPYAGYDIYLAANRLAFAAGALKDKIKDRDIFMDEIRRLAVPKFIEEEINYQYSPEYSPLPPLGELFIRKGPEADFASLYVTKSYYAIKKEERDNGKA